MTTSLINFATGFGINFAIALIIVRFIYYPARRDKSYVFTFLTFNTIIFFVLSLLSSTELSVGVGFGLFAIFSVLRYRTDPMPIREMTYLFAIIALPMMNAMLLSGDYFPQLLLANGIVLAVLFVLEQGWGFRYEAQRKIVYDRLKLLQPQNEELLLHDIQERTGLPVIRVAVGKMDLVKKRANITVFYHPEPQPLLSSIWQESEPETIAK